MRFHALFALSFIAITAGPAASLPRVDPVESILLATPSPDTLRDRLLALSIDNPNSRQALQALYCRGLSFERSAMLDSAIACYRRAQTPGRNGPALSALIDALLRRRAEGDADEAIRALETIRGADTEIERGAAQPDPARLGWAYVVSGDARRGLELLAPLENRLTEDLRWHYRFARAYLAQGNSTRALHYLVSLATAARNQDREVASLLKELDQRLGSNARISENMAGALRAHDDAETAVLEKLGGRRVRIKVSDGAYIGAALFSDSLARRRERAAVILGGLGDEVRDYDSLTVALRRSGFAVLLVDPRGSGWSVAPGFSLPDTWDGRQNALAARVANDVRDALDALPRVAKVDTSRVLLIGVGTMAPMAISAAAADARIVALGLLDPWTSPVDRGATLADARRGALPAFIQLSVPGRSESVFADTLFRTFAQRASRFVESTALSTGGAAFGSRPDVTPRFVRWLGEIFAVKPVRRVIRPSTPRPG